MRRTTAAVGLSVAGWLLGMTGCGDDEPRDIAAGPSGDAAGALDTSTDVEENTGEAESALVVTKGLACEFACQGAAAAGCAAVALACGAGTIWTFGGVSIPCAYAAVAACYAIGGAGAVCTRLCGGA